VDIDRRRYSNGAFSVYLCIHKVATLAVFEGRRGWRVAGPCSDDHD
jgi:hypothetical protein